MAAILIVDDEAFQRRPLASLLKFEGYEITEASDGLEGLQRLKEKPHDLVLLDMLMPGMDGVMMLQAIRKQEKWARLPVLLCTGQHEPRLLHKAKLLGVQEYVFKGDTPFSRLLELVKRHLGEHHVPKRRGRKPKPRPVPPPGMEQKPERLKPSPLFLRLEREFMAAEEDAA